MLLALSQSELILEQMYVGLERTIRGSVKHMLREQALSPEQQRAMRRVPAKVIAALREEFNWTLLRPQLISQHRRIFDQQKIDGLIRFYRSPAGRVYQQMMAGRVQGSMALALAQANLLLPRMEQAMDKAVREAKRVPSGPLLRRATHRAITSEVPRKAEHDMREHSLVPFSVVNQRRQP